MVLLLVLILTVLLVVVMIISMFLVVELVASGTGYGSFKSARSGIRAYIIVKLLKVLFFKKTIQFDNNQQLDLLLYIYRVFRELDLYFCHVFKCGFKRDGYSKSTHTHFTNFLANHIPLITRFQAIFINMVYRIISSRITLKKEKKIKDYGKLYLDHLLCEVIGIYLNKCYSIYFVATCINPWRYHVRLLVFINE